MELKGRFAHIDSIVIEGFNRTFMELKVLLGLGYSCDPLVSIAPLWNWKCSCHGSCGLTLRFNRTFMELKVRSVTDNVYLPWFQSHLYGIERILQRNNKTHINCFNRTFMELKGKFTRTFTVTSFVSIAPLWNWKLYKARATVLFLQFQSHLYGIERR